MVHLAHFVDVIMQGRNLHFFFGQDGAGLVKRPRKIIAIIVHRNVGILRSIEAATLPVAQPLVHPANNVACDICHELRAGGLIGMHIVLQ